MFDCSVSVGEFLPGPGKVNTSLNTISLGSILNLLIFFFIFLPARAAPDILPGRNFIGSNLYVWKYDDMGDAV